MNNTIALSQTQFGQLVTRLERIEKMLFSLVEPPKGTEAWWRWSDQKGLADIEAGSYVHIQNEKELKELFPVYES